MHTCEPCSHLVLLSLAALVLQGTASQLHPKIESYSVVTEYHHDPAAFTQGEA